MKIILLSLFIAISLIFAMVNIYHLGYIIGKKDGTVIKNLQEELTIFADKCRKR